MEGSSTTGDENADKPKILWRDDFCYEILYEPTTRYSFNLKPDQSKQRNIIIKGYAKSKSFQEVILKDNQLLSNIIK